MRSSEVKNFESHVKSLADLNTALKGVGIKSVHVGKLGHVKFTLRYRDEIGVDHKASFSRRELVRFATQLAKDKEYKNLSDDFKDFQDNYSKLVLCLKSFASYFQIQSPAVERSKIRTYKSIRTNFRSFNPGSF